MWDTAIATAWRRWAGHFARLTERKPDRWVGIATWWSDAWWRQTIRCMLHSEANPGRILLNRGHRFLGKQRWEEVIQKQGEESSGTRQPWQQRTRPRCLESRGTFVRRQNSPAWSCAYAAPGQDHETRSWDAIRTVLGRDADVATCIGSGAHHWSSQPVFEHCSINHQIWVEVDCIQTEFGPTCPSPNQIWPNSACGAPHRIHLDRLLPDFGQIRPGVVRHGLARGPLGRPPSRRGAVSW